MDPMILKFAGWTVLAMLVMLTGGFFLNAFEQVKVHGDYSMPKDYFDMFLKIALAAVSCLWVGNKVSKRKKQGEDKE